MSRTATAREHRGTVARAQLRRKSQLTLPAEVREALHVEEGDELEFVVDAEGTVRVRGLAVIDAEQRWFWTAEWQAGEREASHEIADGKLPVFDDVNDMFDALES